MTLVLTAVGCKKIDTPAEIKDVNITFQMGDKPGFDTPTKAIKSEWADGDYVTIAFKPKNYDYCLSYTSGSYKDFRGIILEWDKSGSRWIPHLSNLDAEHLPSLGTTGTYYAIHHRGGPTLTSSSSVGQNNDIFELKGYKGGELLYAKGTYNMSGSNLDLGIINMNLDPRLFQISVSDELNGGYMFLSQGYDESGSMEIPNAENTMALSIYTQYSGTTTIEPEGYIGGTVALRNGAVAVDFSTEHIFEYNSGNSYKVRATPVVNYNSNTGVNDYSFCFAITGKMMGILANYVFYIERNVPSGETYTIPANEDVFYKIYEAPKTSGKEISKGKAIWLMDTGWSAQ